MTKTDAKYETRMTRYRLVAIAWAICLSSVAIALAAESMVVVIVGALVALAILLKSARMTGGEADA